MDKQLIVLSVISEDIEITIDQMDSYKDRLNQLIVVKDFLHFGCDPFEMMCLVEMKEIKELTTTIGRTFKALGIFSGTIDISLSEYNESDEEFETPPYIEEDDLALADIINGRLN
jgi:hypothetical protein